MLARFDETREVDGNLGGERLELLLYFFMKKVEKCIDWQVNKNIHPHANLEHILKDNKLGESGFQFSHKIYSVALFPYLVYMQDQ